MLLCEWRCLSRVGCVEVEYNGVKYPSISALAAECGKSSELLYSRIVVHKWSVDRAVTAPFRGVDVLEYDGVEYCGINALSEFSGVPYAVLRRRIKDLKWSVDKAVNTPVNTPGCDGDIFEYNGVKYSNLHAVAKATGRSYTRLYDRVVKHNWDLARAIETPPTHDRPVGAKQVEIGGKLFASRKLACLEYGISYNTVRSRMNKYSISFEEALLMETKLESVLRSNADIRCFKRLCSDRYVLLTCSVCERSVLLPLEDTKVFEHSELCEKYEWNI